MDITTITTAATNGALAAALVLCGIALVAVVGSPKHAAPQRVRVVRTDRGFGSPTRGGDTTPTDVLRSCEARRP